MDAVDLLLGYVVRDFHVKIPSCLMPRAKENRVLEQGSLTARRNEFVNVCWPFTCVGKLKMGTGHSPALQVAIFDLVSKKKMEEAVKASLWVQEERRERKRG